MGSGPMLDLRQGKGLVQSFCLFWIQVGIPDHKGPSLQMDSNMFQQWDILLLRSAYLGSVVGSDQGVHTQRNCSQL